MSQMFHFKKMTTMKTMNINKMMAVMMTALTTSIPAMAGNNKGLGYVIGDAPVSTSTTRGNVASSTSSTRGNVTPTTRGNVASSASTTRGNTTHAVHNNVGYTTHDKGVYVHHNDIYRPIVKTYKFKVSNRKLRHGAIHKIERLPGVMTTHYDPRTHKITVRYDARMTTSIAIRNSI